MERVEYGEAAAEVLDILNHTRQEDFAKIPQSFIKFLMDISSKNYQVKLNHEQPIYGLNLNKQTKELLGFIYITWWCEPEKYEIYKRQIQEKKMTQDRMTQTELVNTIFANRREKKEQRISQNKTSMIEYKNVNRINQIFDKIRNFFNRGKKGTSR